MGFTFQGGITNNKGFARADGYSQLPTAEVFLGPCSNQPRMTTGIKDKTFLGT